MSGVLVFFAFHCQASSAGSCGLCFDVGVQVPSRHGCTKPVSRLGRYRSSAYRQPL